MIQPDRFEIFADNGTRIFGATEACCREWVAARPDAIRFNLARPPYCSCCGAMNAIGGRQDVVAVRTLPLMHRCSRHRDKNPCAVLGCPNMRASGGVFADDLYLCSRHWRIAAPPGSVYRRIYNRIFTAARKAGVKPEPRWPPAHNARYWRIWGKIVARARDQTAGDIDMDEINKLFGWTE